LADADLYVGHDAGMTHLAALTGMPTIAIFGPTDARIWGPLGARCETTCFPDERNADAWIERLTFRIGEWLAGTRPLSNAKPHSSHGEEEWGIRSKVDG
jgi:hypothetical protein